MDQNTAGILLKYHDYLQKRKKSQEGFWSKFARRTSLRVRKFFNQPIESAIYYTLSALPVPLWSEQDAAQVTEWFSKSALGSKSGFEAPHAPSEKEESLMKSVAAKEFKRFLGQDPQAKVAFVQHYQQQHGEIPKELHLVLPRQTRIALPPASHAHNLAGVQRQAQGKPLGWRRPLRPAFGFR